MRKKTFMATIILCAFLVSLVAGMQAVKVAKANPFPDGAPNPPPIIIQSPQNLTYNQSDIPLIFTIVNASQYNYMYFHIANISYVLDGKQSYLDGSTNATLTGLSEGEHILSIIVGEEGVYESNIQNGLFPYTEASTQTVSFTVKTEPQVLSSPTLAPASPALTRRPTISILYPLNDSFFNVSLGGVNYQLTYETNSTLSWVGYSIDGSNNATVTGNSTFVQWFVTSSGYHTLTVYANDTSGNWANPQTVTYLVNFNQPTIPPDYTPTPPPSPAQPTIEPSPSAIPTLVPSLSPDHFPLFLSIEAILIIILAVVILLAVYPRRTKRQK